jgi:hypothetical protein
MLKINFRRLSVWAGVIAPLLFVSIFTIEGNLRPGYNAMSMYISALSLGSRGWIQIINFIILGSLIFIFTLGLSKEFTTGKASRGGIIALYILALLFFISGPFIMDPADTPASQLSVHGLIHGLSGGIVFLVMPITIFLFMRRIMDEKIWKSFRLWTILLGIIEVIGVILFTYVSKIPTGTNPFLDWLGLFQRIALIPFMIWLFLFSIQLLKKQK